MLPATKVSHFRVLLVVAVVTAGGGGGGGHCGRGGSHGYGFPHCGSGSLIALLVLVMM